MWLFHQQPQALDPLAKYLSGTTGLGSNYVTAEKVSALPAGAPDPPRPSAASCSASLMLSCVSAAVSLRLVPVVGSAGSA